VEFEILANYNPLPEGESYASQKTVKRDSQDEAVPGVEGRHRGAAGAPVAGMAGRAGVQ